MLCKKLIPVMWKKYFVASACLSLPNFLSSLTPTSLLRRRFEFPCLLPELEDAAAPPAAAPPGDDDEAASSQSVKNESHTSDIVMTVQLTPHAAVRASNGRVSISCAPAAPTSSLLSFDISILVYSGESSVRVSIFTLARFPK